MIVCVEMCIDEGWDDPISFKQSINVKYGPFILLLPVAPCFCQNGVQPFILTNCNRNDLLLYLSCGDPSKNFEYLDQMWFRMIINNDAMLRPREKKNDVNERTIEVRPRNFQTQRKDQPKNLHQKLINLFKNCGMHLNTHSANNFNHNIFNVLCLLFPLSQF